MAGYAYILTHPGNPSIAYDHFVDCYLKGQTKALADIRAMNGITSSSTVTILAFEPDLYMAKIDDSIIVKIGTRWELGSLLPPPDDFEIVTDGTDYCVWEKKK